MSTLCIYGLLRFLHVSEFPLTLKRWRYFILMKYIIYFSHYIESSMCICAYIVWGLDPALGHSRWGSIKQNSLHKINYSCCGLGEAYSKGDACCRLCDQCSYICASSHSSVLIVLARTSLDLASQVYGTVAWSRRTLLLWILTQSVSQHL
jgi:hypothetical protein